MEDLPPDYVFGTLPENLVYPEEERLGQLAVPAGTTILRQGASATKFFIIVTGEVEVVRTSHSAERVGAERIVARLGPGQFFGEIAILRDMARTATVRAITDATLLTMDRSKFRSLVERSLGMARDFDTIIEARLSALLADEDDENPE
jgi:CRP-like cAMP-binding protein